MDGLMFTEALYIDFNTCTTHAVFSILLILLIHNHAYMYIYTMKLIILCSEGQEKYLREPSITPVGYFAGVLKNHSRAMRYFRGMIFPMLALH
jgi:hypothetical protein